MPAERAQNQGPETTQAYWVTGEARAEIRETLLTTPDEPWVEVRTLYSGVSRGTESLVYGNKVPPSEHQRMRAPFQEGDFPAPVKYGYSSVGEVVDGPADLQGKAVFCLYPHQARYRVPVSAVVPLPADVPPARAVLAANMETAVNGLWDASPAVGDRIAVIGCGVVGCLIAWLASRIPGTRVTAIDTDASRREVLQALGVAFSTQGSHPDHDLVIHASGHPAGLEHALTLAGQEGTVVEMSWFGEQPVTLSLGQAFHSRRLTIRASQVGQVSPRQRARWQYRDRMQLALSLLADPVLDGLISGESAFAEMPQTMADLVAPGQNALCHRIVY